MKEELQSSSILDNLYIASPCSVSWDSMQGDDRTRLCGGCERNVYNISDMTKKEAEKFLTCNGTKHCLTFYRRHDGTILTDDCPVALRKIRDQCKMVARVAASIVAFFLSLPSTLAQPGCDLKGAKPSQVKGNVALPAGDAAVAPSTKPSLMKPGEAMIPPVVHTRGRPAMVNQVDIRKTPPIQVMGGAPALHVGGEPMVTPTSTTPQPTKPVDGPKTDIKLHAEQNIFLHKEAHEFFKKGQEAAAKSQGSLAEFYYEKALDAYDKQPLEGDKQFRKLIEQQLEKVRSGKDSKP